ncbi:hypothetical protein GCM10010421_41260 [Streptomyces glaucus]|uniref:Secreted protein n=1 Tax=Streptomyces glaucus TaxID=284029 RepID=A0ABN3K1H3_9ACTN
MNTVLLAGREADVIPTGPAWSRAAGESRFAPPFPCAERRPSWAGEAVAGARPARPHRRVRGAHTTRDPDGTLFVRAAEARSSPQRVLDLPARRTPTGPADGPDHRYRGGRTGLRAGERIGQRKASLDAVNVSGLLLTSG